MAVTEDKFYKIMEWVGDPQQFKRIPMSEQMAISGMMYELAEKIEPYYDKYDEERVQTAGYNEDAANIGKVIVGGFLAGLFGTKNRQPDPDIIDQEPMLLERRDKDI